MSLNKGDSPTTFFCFILKNYLVYCYASSTHCTFIFTLILTYFLFFPFDELECKISVKISGSVLDSALPLRGKEGDTL